MPLLIVRNDITKMKVDAIVNAANNSLMGGGGVDGAIHRAAGASYEAECRKLRGCATGEAKLTGAGALPARYVINTVGPVWRGGEYGEREQLISCYRNSLKLASRKRCRSVAFPLISSGGYGYPKREALQVAVDTIREFLRENELTVYLVIFDRDSYQISKELIDNIAAYIDDRYVASHLDMEREQRSGQLDIDAEYVPYPAVSAPIPEKKESKPRNRGRTTSLGEFTRVAAAMSLEEAVRELDESFSQMLLRKIDEKGLTDVQCYKRANIDRKLFSKIRGDKNYRPKKSTALAFAVALELTLPETRELLMKAGYALSHSNRFDIIVEYFITRGSYDIFEINEALFAFDENLLGA